MYRSLQAFTLVISILVISLASGPAFAGGVYQEPADFIKEVFNGKPPRPSAIWLNKDLKKQVEEILSHPYKGLRVRYWEQQLDTGTQPESNKVEPESAAKTAWVLEEIGKEKPITAGFVVVNHQIERVKILVFRESRGWEVRHTFFTEQFDHAKLTRDDQLDTRIDNISGATLSVRAVSKLARVALLLDRYVAKSKTMNADKPASKSSP